MYQGLASTKDSVFKQLIEAKNSHDLEKMLALRTDDVIVEDVPFGMVRKGKDGVKQGFTCFYTTQFQILRWSQNLGLLTTSRLLWKRFLLERKLKCHGLPATGKGFSVRVCSIGEFENGKVRGRRDYWDSATLTKQLVGEQ